MTRRSTAIGYVAFQTATERRTGVRLLTGAPARSHRGRGCGSSYQDSTIPTRSVQHATRIRDRSERWENLDHIEAWLDLEVRAEARGMSPAKLVRQLLEIIA